MIQLRPVWPYMRKASAIAAHQEFLVAEERDVGLRQRRGGDECADVVAHRIGHEFRVEGAPHEEVDRRPHQDGGDDHHGAEEPRGAAGPGELPPELLRVVDVAVVEEAEPCRGHAGGESHREPARRYAERAHRAASVEGGAEDIKNERHGDENQRLVPIEAFQKRRGGAGEEQDLGQEPGGAQASQQPARHQEQRHADDASDQMRAFDHEERQPFADALQPLDLRRERGGEKQHGAGEKRYQRGRQGNERPQGPRGLLGCGRDAALVAQAFPDGEPTRRDDERHDVIDEAIDDEAGDNAGAHRLTERGDDRRLENAEAAGGVAREAQKDGAAIEHDEIRKGRHRLGREHDVEDAGRGGEVDGASDDLADRDLAAGQRQGPAEDPQHARGAPEPNDAISERRGQSQSEEDLDTDSERPERRDAARIEDQRRREESDKTEPEGDGGIGVDAQDVGGVEAEHRIDAVAHDARRHRPEAEKIRDGVGGGAGDRRSTRRYLARRDGADRQHVEARDGGKAHCRQEQCEDDLLGADGVQCRAHLRRSDIPEHRADRNNRQDRKADAQERHQQSPEPGVAPDLRLRGFAPAQRLSPCDLIRGPSSLSRRRVSIG